MVAQAARQFTHDALIALLVKDGVACASVSSVAQLVEHPQLHTVQYQLPYVFILSGSCMRIQLTSVNLGIRNQRGEAVVPAPPVTSSIHAHGPPPLGNVPAIGQHTQQIVQEFSS